MTSAEQIIAEVLRERHPVSVVDAAHVVAALADAGKQIVDSHVLEQATGSLDAAATIVGNHATMLAELVMDTPKDQELTDRLVELARYSAQNLRAAAARLMEVGAS